MTISKVDQWIIERSQPFIRVYMPIWKKLTAHWPIEIRLTGVGLWLIGVGIMIPIHVFDYLIIRDSILENIIGTVALALSGIFLTYLLRNHIWQWFLGSRVPFKGTTFEPTFVNQIQSTFPSWRWTITTDSHTDQIYMLFLFRKDAVYAKLVRSNIL